MFHYYRKSNFTIKVIALAIIFVFAFSSLCPSYALAQSVSGLPMPGTMVSLSPVFTPTILRGLRVYPDNSLKFDFIVDSGDTGLKGAALKNESERLIKYFLAALTIPEDNLWVNLSPHEQDRVIPDSLAKTDMGTDMLAQDYLLKQVTASLIYPEDELGKQFWQKIYKKAYEEYGTTNIPVDTFNKVWIMPERAEVYVKDDRAFVVESRLKVMLEEDYVAFEKSQKDVPILTAGSQSKQDNVQNLNVKHPDTLHVRDKFAQADLTSTESLRKPGAHKNKLASDIVREIVIPALEKEVNEGKNFAQLRQIYNSLILAYWFKNNLKESILNRVYSDQSKIKGVDTKDISQDIYKQYIDSFKKGVCDFIKVEYDQYARKNIPRKYFSGGVEWELDGVFNQTSSQRAGSALFNSMEKAEKIVVVTAETKEIASKATVSVIPKKSGSPLTSSLEVYKNLKNTLDGKEIFTGGESYFLYFDIDESLKRGSDLIVDTDIYLIDEKGAKTKSSVCSFSIYDEKEIGFFEFRLDFVNFVPADQKISNLAAEGQVEKILDAITAQNDRELFSGESLGGGFIEQQIMRYLVSVLPNDAKILGYLEHFQVLEAGSDTAIFRDPKSGFLKKKKAGEKGYYFIIGAGEKYLSSIEYMEKNDEVVNASELASLVVLKNADVGSREMDINLSWMVDVLERVEESQTIKGFKAVEGLVDYQEKFLEYQRESDFKKLLSSSDDLEEEDALGFYRKNKNGEIFSESLGFEIIVKKSQSEELKISSALLKKSSKKRWKEIIEDLLSEARKGKVKLVLVDLDNTLMKPKGYIGSEAQKIDSIKKNAFNFAVEMIEGSEDLSGEVIDSIIGEAVRRAQDFVYAQGDKDERRMIKYKVLKIPGLLTPAHLKELMDLGVPVDGSSARPGDEEKVEITLGMLESLGIVMGVNLNNVDFTSGDGRIKALRVQQYIQNFISKQKEIGNIVKAEEIYFIDDLKKNIDSIEGLQTGVKLIQLLSEKNNNHQSDRWGDFYRFARQAAKDGNEDVIEFLLNAYDLAPMHKEQKVVDLAKSILNSIQYSEFEEEIKAKEIRNPFKLNTSIVWMQGVSDEEIERKINEQLSHPQSFGKKKAKAEKRLDWREYSGISSSIMAERDDVLGEEFKKVISSNIFSYDLSGLSVQEVLSDLLQEGVVEVESDDGVAFEFRLYEFSDTWYSIEVNNSDRENIGYFDFRLGSAEYGYEREGERSVALLSEAVHHKGIGRALVSLGLELSKLNGKKLFYLKNVKDLKFFKGYGFKDSFSGKNDLTFNLETQEILSINIVSKTSPTLTSSTGGINGIASSPMMAVRDNDNDVFGAEREEYLRHVNDGVLRPELIAAQHTLSWPVNMSDSETHISNFVGNKMLPILTEEEHPAIDIQTKAGADVSAIADGVVVFVKRYDYDYRVKNFADVWIYSPELNILTLYVHLDIRSLPERFYDHSPFDIFSEVSVKKGEIIGKVMKWHKNPAFSENATINPRVERVYGKSYDHLHLEMRYVPPGLERLNLDELPEVINPLRLLTPLYEISSSPMIISKSSTGGIDFNAENMNLTTKGDGIDFNIPLNMQGVDLSNIEGLTPIIINIAPVTDFYLLLGLGENPQEVLS